MVDSLSISTQGFITGTDYEDNNSFSIATQGFRVEVIEEIIPVPQTPISSGITGPQAKEKEREYKKKITVKVTFPNGDKYEATEIIDDVNLSVSDVTIFKSEKEIELTLENVEMEMNQRSKKIKLLKKEFF